MNNRKSYYYILGGDKGEFEVNAPGYHVIENTWNGPRIVNSRLMESYPETPEGERAARAAAQKLNSINR